MQSWIFILQKFFILLTTVQTTYSQFVPVSYEYFTYIVTDEFGFVVTGSGSGSEQGGSGGSINDNSPLGSVDMSRIQSNQCQNTVCGPNSHCKITGLSQTNGFCACDDLYTQTDTDSATGQPKCSLSSSGIAIIAITAIIGGLLLLMFCLLLCCCCPLILAGRRRILVTDKTSQFGVWNPDTFVSTEHHTISDQIMIQDNKTLRSQNMNFVYTTPPPSYQNATTLSSINIVKENQPIHTTSYSQGFESIPLRREYTFDKTNSHEVVRSNNLSQVSNGYSHTREVDNSRLDNNNIEKISTNAQNFWVEQTKPTEDLVLRSSVHELSVL